MSKFVPKMYHHGKLAAWHNVFKYAGFRYPRGWRVKPDCRAYKSTLSARRFWMPPCALLTLFLLLLAVPAFAADPTSITLTGAGNTSYNGTYTPATGANATFGGYTQYTNGFSWILVLSGTWTCCYGSGGYTPKYKIGPAGSTFPANGTSTLADSAAIAPPPSFTSPGASASTATGSITISPSTITLGQTATLAWSSSNLTNISVSGETAPGASGSVSRTPSQAQTFTYTLSGSGPGGAVFSTSCTLVVQSGTVATSVSGLTVSPSPGTGGSNSTGTVTISAAAPSGGYTVSLASSNTAAASVPASVVVPAGATSATFNVSVPNLTQGASTTLSAVGGAGAAQTFQLSCLAGAAAASNAPTVSISLAPISITAGASSALSWSSSGASSITVTGVASPPFAGSVNVSPTATTTYTVTAVNANGSATQSITLTVSASSTGGGGTGTGCAGTSAGCGDGSSSFTAGLGFLAPPGISAPGDLKIGIPGIGSIGLPTGWWTQIIQYASQAALSAMSLSGGYLTAGMTAASATTNLAVAGVDVDLKAGTAVLQGAALTTQQKIDNAAAIATQVAYQIGDQTRNAVNDAKSAITSATANAEKLAVTDFQAMLQTLLYSLFVPDPAVLGQFESKITQLLDWGPYAFVQSFITAINVPAGDGTLGGVGLGIPEFAFNNSYNTGTFVIGGVTYNSSAALKPNVASSFNGTQPAASSGGVQYLAPGQWYTTGKTIPFDKTALMASPAWVPFRAFEDGCVWFAFVTGLLPMLIPKQVF